MIHLSWCALKRKLAPPAHRETHTTHAWEPSNDESGPGQEISFCQYMLSLFKTTRTSLTSSICACFCLHVCMCACAFAYVCLKPFGTAGKNILLLDSCLRKEKGWVVRVFLYEININWHCNMDLYIYSPFSHAAECHHSEGIFFQVLRVICWGEGVGGPLPLTYAFFKPTVYRAYCPTFYHCTRTMWKKNNQLKALPFYIFPVWRQALNEHVNYIKHQKLILRRSNLWFNPFPVWYH